MSKKMSKKILLLVSIPLVWWLSIMGVVALSHTKSESILLFSLSVVAALLLFGFMWIYTLIAVDLIRD